MAGRLELVEGRLAVGDIRSTAVIEAAKHRAGESEAEGQIRDCPPGLTCPTVHAVEGADCLVLVAEPTEFSLHDLGAALALAKGIGLPVGVVINKEGFGSADIDGFCAQRGAPVLGRIAFKRERAEAGAAARLWTEDTTVMREMLSILDSAIDLARKERSC